MREIPDIDMRPSVLFTRPVPAAVPRPPAGIPGTARTSALLLGALLLLGCAAPRAAGLLHHQLQVEFGSHGILVDDRLQLQAGGALDVELPRSATDLHVNGVASDAGSLRLSSQGGDTRLRYQLPLPDGAPVQLLGAGAWLVSAERLRHTLDLRVAVPARWRSVSQGRRLTSEVRGDTRHEHWVEPHPQATAHLLAGPYHYYSLAEGALADGAMADGNWLAEAYLLNDDAPLARRYLEAAVHYRDEYSALLGAYPYAKFALVENQEQTGYGMPSFTLLGSRVIRLPFIVHTSFPHELLHNWWGNGVYPLYERGNWSEGLTTYLADHWLQERRGRGSVFRRNALLRYRNFALDDRDFPLAEFVSRHSQSARSVGYDKGMMFFHMLRRRLGDEDFIAGLRRLWATHAHTFADYGDLAEAFAPAALQGFMQQWLQRSGAPRLSLGEVTLSAGVLRVEVLQADDEPAWDVQVPVAVVLDDGSTRSLRVHLHQHRQTFALSGLAGAVGVALDPHHDLLRHLADDEAPATLGALFGAHRPRYLLAADLDDDLAAAYRRLALAWSGPQAEVVMAPPAPAAAAPDDPPIWLLGAAHRRDPAVAAALQRAMRMARLGDTSAAAIALADGRRAWLGSDSVVAIDALARRLPHYQRQSFVLFADPDAQARPATGQWLAEPAALRRAVAGQPAPDWSLLREPPALAAPVP